MGPTKDMMIDIMNAFIGIHARTPRPAYDVAVDEILKGHKVDREVVDSVFEEILVTNGYASWDEAWDGWEDIADPIEEDLDAAAQAAAAREAGNVAARDGKWAAALGEYESCISLLACAFKLLERILDQMRDADCT